MKYVAAMLTLVVLVAPSPATPDGGGAAPSVHEVDAAPRSEEEGHYPLDSGGGIAVASADLESYLVDLQERASARTFLLTFPDLLFATGSAQIDVVIQRELIRMADFLRAHPDTTARIIGYADDRGGSVYNMSLAKQRAAGVLSYLIDLGIDADRLIMASRGETNPKRDNQTSDGRDSNRRVQIFVQKAGGR